MSLRSQLLMPNALPYCTQLYHFGPQAKGWQFFGQAEDGTRSKYTVEVINELQDREPQA